MDFSDRTLIPEHCEVLIKPKYNRNSLRTILLKLTKTINKRKLLRYLLSETNFRLYKHFASLIVNKL